VQDFSLFWRDDKFVVRGTRNVTAKRSWFAALFDKRPKQVNKKIEIHYLKKSILWLQIRGEGMRKRPDLLTVWNSHFCWFPAPPAYFHSFPIF